MICSFARKSRHPPQTGVPPSVRRVWPEFPSDSETWIEFRRNYSLRLKPEPARHPCAASPPQQVQIFSNYWGAGNIFKYWAIIEKLVVILSILQISGSRLYQNTCGWVRPNPHIRSTSVSLYMYLMKKRTEWMHQKFRNYHKEAESEVFNNPTTKNWQQTSLSPPFLALCFQFLFW